MARKRKNPWEDRFKASWERDRRAERLYARFQAYTRTQFRIHFRRLPPDIQLRLWRPWLQSRGIRWFKLYPMQNYEDDER